jgi:hypothetical protein
MAPRVVIYQAVPHITTPSFTDQKKYKRSGYQGPRPGERILGNEYDAKQSRDVQGQLIVKISPGAPEVKLVKSREFSDIRTLKNVITRP